MRSSLQMVSILIVIALAATSAGCAQQGPEYRTESKTYTAESARQLLEVDAPTALTEVPANETAAARERALTALRARGGDAAEAADVLTETFVSEEGGVPYLVAWARFEGETALIVLEAVNHGKGLSTGRRLWVLDRDGNVLLSAQK